MIYADVPAVVILGKSWSVLRIVLILALFGFVLKPGRLIRNFKKIPRYIIISLVVLFFLYILSAIYNGWPLYVSEKLTGYILRTGLVILVFVSVYSLNNPKLLFIGLILQGIVMTIAGLIIWREFGTYMAIREIGIGYTAGSPLLYFASYAVAYAAFNVTSGLASISFGSMSKRPVVKIPFTFLGILIIFASIMSSRRAAVVAIVLAVLLILYFERNKTALFLFLAVSIAIVPLIYAGYFDQFFSTRESIQSEFTGGGTGRLSIWAYGISEWEKSPTWGYGPGSQPEIYTEETGFSHSSIVSALLEGGIFAVFPILAILIGISIQTFRAGKRIRFYRLESIWPILFLASLANILVVAIISGDILSLNNGMILLAIVSAYCAKIQHAKFSSGGSDEHSEMALFHTGASQR
jgi:O-antigen ligase